MYEKYPAEKYPTEEEVKKASLQQCREWFIGLPIASDYETFISDWQKVHSDKVKIMSLIKQRIVEGK